MNLRVEYYNSEELLRDALAQFAKGGFLVRVTFEESPALYSAASLELRTPAGETQLASQVVQVMPGLGVALAFDANDEGLKRLVEAAQSEPFSGDAAKHTDIDAQPAQAPESPSEAPADKSASLGRERAAMIQLARHGKKDDRMRIMRSNDKSLHRFVVQNAGLGLDEVVAIAKMSSVGPETLQFVAGRREWATRPDVAIALVRNPKCPIPTAIKMLANVSPNELRQIAKTSNVRPPIVSAARKRVLTR